MAWTSSSQRVDTAFRMIILDERRKPRQGTATCRAAPRRAARTRGGGPTARRQPATMNVGALETRRRLRRPGTSSVGWAGSSDPKDGTGAAGPGGLGALPASSSDEEPRPTPGRSQPQSGASPRPPPPFASHGRPRCRCFVPNRTCSFWRRQGSQLRSTATVMLRTLQPRISGLTVCT